MRNRSRNRNLSQGETELWQRVVARVEPLKNRPLPMTDQSGLVRLPKVPENGPAIHSAYEEIAPVPPPDRRERPLERAQDKPAQPALDRRTAQRLQRGQLPIEGRLDLHGMTQKQAYAALLRFVSASRTYNRRLVLVVTGKGWNPDARKPEEAVGVLRRSVPRWLESPPFTEHVSGVMDAHLRHGGSGALYVMLRRSRRPTA
jgi:DNA-nicking Smr family endonuclease